MAQLQRPATLKEFLIHSLLVWRDRDTLVDRDDDEPTTQLQRPDSDRPAMPPPPRASLTSYVFDLNVVPRVVSRPAFDEPTPSAFWSPVPVAVLAPRRKRPPRSRSLRPARTGGHAVVVRALLFGLILFSAFLTAR